jgi:hypothetical protein
MDRVNPSMELGVLPGVSGAAAGVRCVEGGTRCDGDATGAERETIDEAVGILVRRFPAVVSLEVKGRGETAVLTDKGVRAVSSLASLTCLDLSGCRLVTDEGMRAVVSSSSGEHRVDGSQPLGVRQGHRQGYASCEQLHRAHGSQPPPLLRADRRGGASTEQPVCTYLPQPLLDQRDGSWCAGAPQHHRRP